MEPTGVKQEYQLKTWSSVIQERKVSGLSIKNWCMGNGVSYCHRTATTLERLQKQVDQLKEKCQPFLEALEHFPKLVKAFVDRWKQLVGRKQEQERGAREMAEQKRRAEALVRKQKKRDRGWERRSI